LYTSCVLLLCPSRLLIKCITYLKKRKRIFFFVESDKERLNQKWGHSFL
jgi:hypothetical protein